MTQRHDEPPLRPAQTPEFDERTDEERAKDLEAPGSATQTNPGPANEQGPVEPEDVARDQDDEDAEYDESAPVNDPRASTHRVGLNQTALGRKLPPSESEGQSALDSA